MSIVLGGSVMARTPFTGVLVLFVVAFQLVPIGPPRAQVPGTAGHEHLTEVACVDVPPGEKRPEFGCFNVGTVTGLHFSQASVYWHLRVSKQGGCGGGQKWDWNRGGGRRASMALGIRGQKQC